jgi:phage baseplate assembly protein gpV
MSFFPSSPIDKQTFQNALGTNYQYDSTTGVWNIAGSSATIAGLTDKHVPVFSVGGGNKLVDSPITLNADGTKVGVSAPGAELYALTVHGKKNGSVPAIVNIDSDVPWLGAANNAAGINFGYNATVPWGMGLNTADPADPNSFHLKITAGTLDTATTANERFTFHNLARLGIDSTNPQAAIDTNVVAVPAMIATGYNAPPEIRLRRSDSTTGVDILVNTQDQDVLGIINAQATKLIGPAYTPGGSILSRQINNANNAAKNQWEIQALGGQGHPNGTLTVMSDTVTTTNQDVVVNGSTKNIYSDADKFQDYAQLSTINGFASLNYNTLAYQKTGLRVDVIFYLDGVPSGTGVDFTLPYFQSAQTDSSGHSQRIWCSAGACFDASVYTNGYLTVTGNTVSVYPTSQFNTWTNSGARIASGQFFYYTDG